MRCAVMLCLRGILSGYGWSLVWFGLAWEGVVMSYRRFRYRGYDDVTYISTWGRLNDCMNMEQ